MQDSRLGVPGIGAMTRTSIIFAVALLLAPLAARADLIPPGGRTDRPPRPPAPEVTALADQIRSAGHACPAVERAEAASPAQIEEIAAPGAAVRVIHCSNGRSFLVAQPPRGGSPKIKPL